MAGFVEATVELREESTHWSNLILEQVQIAARLQT